MKQTLLSTAANPDIAIPAHCVTGKKQNLVTALREPKFLRLLTTLMFEAGVKCALTIVAQEPVKGTTHSKGLQMHHFSTPGIQLRWHDEDQGNDMNIQFMVCTPQSVVATTERFHTIVSTAFDRLAQVQRNGRANGRDDKEGKGDDKVNGAKAADVTSGEDPAPVLDEEAVDVLFFGMSEKGHVSPSGIVKRKQVRDELVLGLGVSNIQANTIIDQLLADGHLVNTDHIDYYALGDKWSKHIPKSPDFTATTGDAAPADVPDESGVVEKPQDVPADAGKPAPIAPVPPVEPAAPIAVPAVVTASRKPVSVQVQLARLIRQADEAARKSKRLAELEKESGDVNRSLQSVTGRLAALEEERRQAEQYKATLEERATSLEADIKGLQIELDDPQLKSAQSRLAALQQVLDGDQG